MVIYGYIWLYMVIYGYILLYIVISYVYIYGCAAQFECHDFRQIHKVPATVIFTGGCRQ